MQNTLLINANNMANKSPKNRNPIESDAMVSPILYKL